MSVGSAHISEYPLYRCPAKKGDCASRVTISAEVAEGVVVDAVKAALANAEGRASMQDNARHAEAELQRAQADSTGDPAADRHGGRAGHP